MVHPRSVRAVVTIHWVVSEVSPSAKLIRNGSVNLTFYTSTTPLESTDITLHRTFPSQLVPKKVPITRHGISQSLSQLGV